jgi:hypothetical protein
MCQDGRLRSGAGCAQNERLMSRDVDLSGRCLSIRGDTFVAAEDTFRAHLKPQ